MKRYILLLITLVLLVGCATKNEAYEDFKKSPCACMEKKDA